MEARPTGRSVFYEGLLFRKAESDSTHLFDYFGTVNLFPVALNPALRDDADTFSHMVPCCLHLTRSFTC
jgi:hypothetical protein